MTAIRAPRAASRQRTSPQNGLPELVPYVYGEQTRRNTYAGRIARRNVDGWWLLPAALRAELTRPALTATWATRSAPKQSDASAHARRSPGTSASAPPERRTIGGIQ